MGTHEATVSLLQGLSEDQLIQVQNLAKRYRQKTANNPFRARRVRAPGTGTPKHSRWLKQRGVLMTAV